MASPFERKKLTRVVEQLYPVKMGLAKLFFDGKESAPSDTKKVTIEIVKGNRGAAKYTKRGHRGNQVEKSGYEQYDVEPPYICEEIPTQAGELFYKDVGNDPYKQQDQRRRANRILGRDLRILKGRAQRTELLQVARLLDEGKVTIKESGIERDIDFKMPATNKITLTGGDLWSDKDNSDPIKDIREWKRRLVEVSGLTPDKMVFGASVLDAYFSHPKVIAYYDNRRMTVDSIKADASAGDDGLTFYGKVEGIELYSFDEFVRDDETDTSIPVMPADKIFLGSSDAEVSVEFGALEIVEEKIVYLEARRELADTYTDKNSRTMVARYQTAPLYCLKQSDAFMRIKAV